MIKIKRILCPIDFSECSAVAFDYALKLAVRDNAHFDVLHAYHVPHYARPDLLIWTGDEAPRSITEIAQEQALSKLSEFVKARAPEAELEEHVVLGEAPGAIVSAAEQHKHELIVMGTHGQTNFARFFLGTVTQKVVRKAPCPVLTMHTAPRDKPRRILVPTDFSESSRAALSYAHRFADGTGADIDLLHVWEAPSFLPPEAIVGPQQGTQSLAALAKEQAYADIDGFAETAQNQGISIHAKLVTFGPAARTIIEHAKEHAYDLIAMGTHGYTGVKHLMLGSVTEKVVRYASCPVLTVRH